MSSHTLSHLRAWQDQFQIVGIVGLAVGVVVVYTLRELDPALRDQIMVSLKDRALVEVRAKGIDVDAATRHPWRQMITAHIVSSAFAIGFFLMFYYRLVGALVIYLEALGAAADKVTYLAKHGPAVVSAAKENPRQWQHWWVVTAAGQLIFVPLIFVMVGPWTPAGGRRRDEEQERQLQAAVDARA